jgi:hypothetical protein
MKPEEWKPTNNMSNQTETTEVERCPSVLDSDNYSYKERRWTSPAVEEGEEIIFDEPGRILPPTSEGGHSTDCRSHYFRVTKPRIGFYRLRVKHGAGEEWWNLDYSDRTVYGLRQMDSDSRFRLLWVIMDAHKEGEKKGESKYRQYFLEGRLKKRTKNRVSYVSVLPKVTIVDGAGESQ